MRINLFGKIFLIIISAFIIYEIVYFIGGIVNPPLFVTVEFNELGPIYKRMPVYYKGYKIGITEKIKPSDDYTTTLVTIKFYPHDLKLPNNTRAKVKPLTTTRDYIELLYPQKSSGTILKTGDKIQGSTTIDVQSFMNAQYESGAIGYIIENASLTLTSIAKAGNEATKLLRNINLAVQENRRATKGILDNINKMTFNAWELSEKLNNSVSQEDFLSSNKNIQETLHNTEQLTQNLNKTITRLDSVLYNIDKTTSNVNDISEDVKTAINNRTGISRILLGKKDIYFDKYANCK